MLIAHVVFLFCIAVIMGSLEIKWATLRPADPNHKLTLSFYLCRHPSETLDPRAAVPDLADHLPPVEVVYARPAVRAASAHQEGVQP